MARKSFWILTGLSIAWFLYWTHRQQAVNSEAPSLCSLMALSCFPNGRIDVIDFENESAEVVLGGCIRRDGGAVNAGAIGILDLEKKKIDNWRNIEDFGKITSILFDRQTRAGWSNGAGVWEWADRFERPVKYVGMGCDWFVKTNDAIVSTCDSDVWCHNLSTNESIRICETPSRIRTLSLPSANGRVAIGCEDGHVFEIDANRGTSHRSVVALGSPVIGLFFANKDCLVPVSAKGVVMHCEGPPEKFAFGSLGASYVDYLESAGVIAFASGRQVGVASRGSAYGSIAILEHDESVSSLKLGFYQNKLLLVSGDSSGAVKVTQVIVPNK